MLSVGNVQNVHAKSVPNQACISHICGLHGTPSPINDHYLGNNHCGANIHEFELTTRRNQNVVACRNFRVSCTDRCIIRGINRPIPTPKQPLGECASHNLKLPDLVDIETSIMGVYTMNFTTIGSTLQIFSGSHVNSHTLCIHNS